VFRWEKHSVAQDWDLSEMMLQVWSGRSSGCLHADSAQVDDAVATSESETVAWDLATLSHICQAVALPGREVNGWGGTTALL